MQNGGGELKEKQRWMLTRGECRMWWSAPISDLLFLFIKF